MGLRDDILSIDDLPTTEVEVPEWGLSLYVRAMNGSERDQYEVSLMDTKDLPLKEKLRDMRAKLVVLTTVDENGKRVFSDGDIVAVGAKSAKALNRLVDVSQKLNALTDNEVSEEVEN